MSKYGEGKTESIKPGVTEPLPGTPKPLLAFIVVLTITLFPVFALGWFARMTVLFAVAGWDAAQTWIYEIGG